MQLVEIDAFRANYFFFRTREDPNICTSVQIETNFFWVRQVSLDTYDTSASISASCLLLFPIIDFRFLICVKEELFNMQVMRTNYVYMHSSPGIMLIQNMYHNMLG